MAAWNISLKALFGVLPITLLLAVSGCDGSDDGGSGSGSGELSRVIHVPADQTTYKVDGLSDGTWHFAVTALDRAGLESGKSAIVSKAI